MQTKKKLKLKKSVIFKFIAFLIIFLSIFVFVMFIRLNVLPIMYLFLIFCLLLIIDIVVYLLMSRKNGTCRMIGTVLCIFLFCFYFIGIKYQNITLNFLHQFSFLNIETEHYQIIVSNESSIQSLNDLTNQKVAFVENRLGANKAYEMLNKEKNLEMDSKESVSELVKAFLNKEVDVILLEKTEEELYNDMSSAFKSGHKVLDTMDIEVQKEDFRKEVAITKEPFSVYVTGVDTYDGITSIARSDVNMIVTVNPITHKILLTSIPRDYYVQIHGTTGLKDKLTHAGLQGVETSIGTIEDLLDMDINYYIKFNFTALIQIVDAIGGIEVDSPFAFTADYEEDTHIYYEFQKGINKLDGKQALAYVRERYGLREGDVARAKHQQQVVEAVVNKLTTTTILTKYGALLGSMEGNFSTNFDFDSITSFIQMQLESMPSWTIETQVLSGSDASRKTASMPDLYSSVMEPDEESVAQAIQKIDEITKIQE